MQTEQANAPSNPTLKRGIEFFPIDVGLYHVFDPSTSKHFRMGQQEVQWLRLLDGERSTEALRDHIPFEYFDGFFAAAARLNLLEGLRPQRKFDLFKIKIPLNNPNSLLDKMGRFTVLYRVLLNRLSAFLFLLNLTVLLILGRKAVTSLGSVHFSAWVVVFYLAAILLIAFCHEGSHSIVAKSYGVNVPAVGFLLLYLQPAFYADVSGIGLIQRRRPRINVLLAGVMANNVLVSISLFLFFLLRDPLRIYMLYFIWMNVIIILMNLIPFVEYDGYYILQELLNEPDLASRARQSVLRKTPRRFDYLVYLVLSQAFSAALVFSIVLTLRRYALHFTHAGYINYACGLLMTAAYGALAVSTARKVVKP
jgi:putative peptide zinc metalloprotease protein